MIDRSRGIPLEYMMKSSKFLFLSLVVGSLAVGGACKGGSSDAPAAEGSAAPAEAPEASEPAAPAEASEPAPPAPAAEGSDGSGAAAAMQLPVSDFVATAEALHGSWNADFQKMLASQPMAEEERALAQAMLGSATMTLTFNADGTMKMDGTMMGQVQSETGTWTFVSADANKLNISATTQKEGSEPETQAMTVAFATATEMVMTDGSANQMIPFNRAVPGAAPEAPAAPVAPTTP